MKKLIVISAFVGCVSSEDEQKPACDYAASERHADSSWSQAKYEDSIFVQPMIGGPFSIRNPHRETYCEAVQEQESSVGKVLFSGCMDRMSISYREFRFLYNDRLMPIETIAEMRQGFVSPRVFYDLLVEPEFATGWRDIQDVIIGDSTYFQIVDGKPAQPTSPMREKYLALLPTGCSEPNQ